MFRSLSASRLQLRLADGKSLLGVHSVRSARQVAQWSRMSRLQLRLADGKSLLGVHSVRSARQVAQWSRMRTTGEGGLSLVFASRAAEPRPVTVDSYSASHLHDQTMLQSHTEHLFYRGGRKRCPPPTASTLTGASDGDCQKSRLQLRLADGKSLLGVHSVRSARQVAQWSRMRTEAREACPSFSPREPLSRIRRRQDGVRAADTLCGEHRRRLSSLETATVKSTARTNEKNSVRSLYVNT